MSNDPTEWGVVKGHEKRKEIYQALLIYRGEGREGTY